MINRIEEKPSDEKHGRALYNTVFVENEDIVGKNILDVGCGFGWMEVNLLSRGAGKITGTEISENDLKTIKTYLSDERIDCVVASAVKLPFESQSFDTVISWEVLEHIPKDQEDEMFAEAWRVLKPGGIFYLSTPHKSFFSNIFDPAWWLIGHRHYSENQLNEFAKKQNFVVEHVIVNGGWWEIIGINDLYIAKWIFRRRPFFQNFINQKQDEEYKKEKGFTGIFIKLRKNV